MTTRYTVAELEALLAKVEGLAGQRARVEAIKLAIARLKAEESNG